MFLIVSSFICLTESLISTFIDPNSSFIYTERQSFVLLSKLKFIDCGFNLIYARYDNFFLIKEFEIFNSSNFKILLKPAEDTYNKFYVVNSFFYFNILNIPNSDNLYLYLSNSTFLKNENEVSQILLSAGQNSLIMIEKCSFYNFDLLIELFQNNTLIVNFSKFYYHISELYYFISSKINNILILKNSLIFGKSSNFLGKGLIILNKFNKFKMVKTHIDFKSVTNENVKELNYFFFFDISLWNLLLIKDCKFSIKQFPSFINSIFQNFLVFESFLFDDKLTFAKNAVIINFSRFLFKYSSILNNTSNFIDGRDSWIKFVKIKLEKFEKKLILCKDCSIIINDSKFSGKNMKSFIFLDIIGSNLYFKTSEISFIKIQEEVSILKIDKCKILIKKCTFHNLNLQNIRASFLDVTNFGNVIFFKRCSFVKNRGLVGLIHLNRSLNNSIYFFSNIFEFLPTLYGTLLKINNSSANIKFYKNQISIVETKIFGSSRESLIFINKSFAHISFFMNMFQRVLSNHLIFLEKNIDRENLNLIADFSDSIHIKIGTEYIDAYFIDQQLQTKSKSCILQKVHPGKEYNFCLCSIYLFDGYEMPYHDLQIEFHEIFEIYKTDQNHTNEFNFKFLNIEGKFCLSGSFEMLKFYSEFETSELQITFKSKPIPHPLFLIIDFEILCSKYEYIDINGNCRFCPTNYFPLSFFEYSSSSKNSLSSKLICKLCDKDNAFYCFGEDKISPKPNFWQIKIGANSSIFLRCQYDYNCRGDNRNFHSYNFVYKELYTLGICIQNSKGILCSDCKRNYGRWFEEECEPCFQISNLIFLIFQLLVKLIICSNIIYFSMKLFLSSIDEDDDVGKESKIIFHYESFSVFIQLMNSFVVNTTAVKLYIFRFILRLTLIFSSNLDFAIPYECFLRNEEIKKRRLFLKLWFILTIVIAPFILLFLYQRRKINAKIKILGSAKFCKLTILIILYKCLNLFSYNLVEFCTKIFFNIEIKNEDTQEYLTIFLYGFKFEIIRNYFSLYLKELVVLFSIIAIINVVIILEVFAKKKFLYKILQLLFPLSLTVILNYLKFVRVSNYRNLNDLLNLTCILILIYLIIMIILKPKNQILGSFSKSKQINLKFYFSFLIFIILYNISLLQERLQILFDAMYSIFFFLIVCSEIFIIRNIDSYLIKFLKKKSKQRKKKIKILLLTCKNLKYTLNPNKLVGKDFLFSCRKLISSKNHSIKRNIKKLKEKITSLLFLRHFFFRSRASSIELPNFMINNSKFFFRNMFILNYFPTHEKMEFSFQIQKFIFIEFLLKRESMHIDIFYRLYFDKRSVWMSTKVLIIAQFGKYNFLTFL